LLKGTVRKGAAAEYGLAKLTITTKDSLFREVASREQNVWMSHRDIVATVPAGFESLAETSACPVAAMGDHVRRIYGVQFHPEVAHTKAGMDILRAFAKDICRCEHTPWDPKAQIEKLKEEIVRKAGNKRVLFFVSGGVDSTVALILCVEALGKERVHGVFVDTGFMRQVDLDDVRQLAATGQANIRIFNAQKEFLKKVSRTCDPERKRELIGEHFITVHDRILRERFGKGGEGWLLGQGTIYPDTIESGGTQLSSTIKTHHNRVATVRQLLDEGRVIEPLSQFYKDEVRQIGESLRIDRHLVSKQPFPGPGLAIRCLACADNQDVEARSDVSDCAALYGFVGAKVNLKSVGVKGDERSYQNVAILAGNGRFSALEDVSTSITNQVIDINRVIYYVSNERFRPDRWEIRSSRVSPQRVDKLRAADAMVRECMLKLDPDLFHSIWQFPVILIPLFDKKKNQESIVVRPIDSVDGMTASFTKMPRALLYAIAEALDAKLGLRTFFDVTNKPPATIEWE
jgi:GMP synthase (glutamine-hydrolysing)